MSVTERPAGFRSPRIGRAVALVVPAALCILSIRSWAGRLNLSPDSTTYITAAVNWTRTGRLFYFANAASWSMAPEVEPYTEQPPGFVYFLAPFVLIAGEPMTAALIGQAAAIVLFYLALVLILDEMGLHVILRVCGMAVFAFLAPFVEIHSFLWSETLFIAVTLATGWVALRLIRGKGGRGAWLALVGLLAAGSAIRLVGVANAAWILPLLLRRRSLRAALRLLVHPIVTWALFLVGCTFIVIFLFADALGFGTRGGIGPTQLLGIVMGTLALLLGAGALVLVRAKRVAAWSAGSDAGQGGVDLWPAAAAAASILPVLLWFLRNEALYGAFSLTNRAFEVFHPEHLRAPFEYFFNEALAARYLPAGWVAACVVLLLVLPFIVHPRTRALAQGCMISAALAQFAAVYVPSLASEISGLGHRLLSPSIALFALATLHGFQSALDALAKRRWAPALLILPLAFLAGARGILPGELLSAPRSVNYPIEMELWRELRDQDVIQGSSHFYSDRDFIHQIFAGIPQRILWDASILRDTGAVAALLGSGERPFFLVRAASWEAGRLEELMASGELPLEAIAFSEYGFKLYRQPD